MTFVSFYLFYVIIILILIVYFDLIYKCKRGVRISIEKFNVQNKISHAKTDNNVIIVDNEQLGSSNDEYLIYPQPPGPLPWPILGNLAILGQFDSPFKAFSELSKKYGDIFGLMLGNTRCVVVNNLDLIKEVLNENGKYFGGRPDFIVSKFCNILSSQEFLTQQKFFLNFPQRYRRIFGGDRNNCEYSVEFI